MQNCYYRIIWSSVDGAGGGDEQIEDIDVAINRATEWQGDAERSGNVWSYEYKVSRVYRQSSRRDTVYNARTGERQPKDGESYEICYHHGR